MAQPTLGIKIEGYGRVKRRFSRMKTLPLRMKGFLRKEVADAIIETTRELVPVKTGLLYSTVQKRKTEGGVIVSVGEPNPDPPATSDIPRRKEDVPIHPNTPAPYALWVHDTHRTHSGFLTKAYVEHIDPLKKELRKIVKEVVHG